MNLPKNHELNTLLGRAWEEWRIFDMLKEAPTIEKNILPWIYALWIQVGALFLFLVILFVFLKKESMKLNKEVLGERKETGKNFRPAKKTEVTEEIAFNAEWHDAAKKFYIEKDLIKAEEDLDIEANSIKESGETTLTNLLQKEYDKALQKYDQQPNHLSICRKEVMTKIRCNLVKNPYDTGGRILANEAKNVFIKNVLQEKKWTDSLLEHIKIPNWIRKKPMYNQIMNYFPLAWAILSVLRGLVIYSYDISTDVSVIEKIQVTADNFSIPEVSQFDENFTVSKLLVENMARHNGASIFRQPCLPIRDVENMLRESRNGYDQFFYDLGNVRLLDSLDNDTFLGASDVTNFTGNVFQVIEKLNQTTENGIFPLKNLSKKIEGVFNVLQELTIPVKNVVTGVKMLFGNNSAIDEAEKYLNDAKYIWEDIETNIVYHQLTSNIINKIDSFWEKRKGIFPEDLKPFITFLREASEKLNKNYLKHKSKLEDLPQPDPYNATEHFNDTQLFCRKYVNEVFRLFQCNDSSCKYQPHKKAVIETTKKIFATRDYDSSFDNAAKSLRRNAKLSTNIVFRCIRLYLTFLLGFIVVRECYTSCLDISRYNIIPIATHVDLMKMELTKTSKMFTKSPMNNRDVIVNALRFDLNINEATKETLRAVCVQIALFMYLNTMVFALQDIWSAAIKNSNVTNPSSYEMSIEKFNLDETYVEFYKSPIYDSFIMGMISVAFAQFQMYSVRHGGDLELMGKLIYFATCLLNTISIFLSMTMYYSMGLPNFIMMLIVIIRRVCGYSDEDKFIPLPESNEFILEVLIIAFALVPLVLLPNGLAYFLHNKTNSFIMQEKVQRSAGIQSGYDVPGHRMGLYMFLPQSYFDYRDPSAVHIKCFNRNPLSRKFYRLRFKLHLWNKTFVHFSSLALGAVCLHSLDYLIEKSSLFEPGTRFMFLRVPIVKRAAELWIALTVPCLMMTYGMLYIYYRFFHPWKSEGVSVGFMPGNVEKNSIHESDFDCSFNKIEKTSVSPPKKSPWRFLRLNEETSYYKESTWATGIWQNHSKIDANMF